MMRVARLRRRGLRRMTMLDLDYPASPLLERGARARGVRLPNPLLRAPDGRAGPRASHGSDLPRVSHPRGG
jgi:hypothetical protein